MEEKIAHVEYVLFNFRIREKKSWGIIDTLSILWKKCRCVISVTNYVIFKGLKKFNFSLFFAKLKIKILKGEREHKTQKRMIEICSHFILSHTTTINYMLFFHLFIIISD